MRFWDSSALVPLCVSEASSTRLRRILGADRSVVIWWLTAVECASALWRRGRDATLSRTALARALADLHELLDGCETVGPAEVVRERAQRLLAVHPLRAADALQLAAALVRVRDRPSGTTFVCLDERLRDAALREGFSIVP